MKRLLSYLVVPALLVYIPCHAAPQQIHASVFVGYGNADGYFRSPFHQEKPGALAHLGLEGRVIFENGTGIAGFYNFHELRMYDATATHRGWTLGVEMDGGAHLVGASYELEFLELPLTEGYLASFAAGPLAALGYINQQASVYDYTEYDYSPGAVNITYPWGYTDRVCMGVIGFTGRINLWRSWVMGSCKADFGYRFPLFGSRKYTSSTDPGFSEEITGQGSFFLLFQLGASMRLFTD